MPHLILDFSSFAMRRSWVRIPSRPPNLKMLKAPSSTVNCSTRAGWRCSPVTRAPTSAVSSPVTRLAASRVVPGTLQDHRDSPRPRRLLWVCDPAGSSGRGATFAPKSRIGDVWSATLPQSDKGRVARHSGGTAGNVTESPECLPKIVPRKSCALSAKGDSSETRP
jgi:hypothetical protein